MLQTDSKTLSDNSDFIFDNRFLAKFFFNYEPFQKYVVTKFLTTFLILLSTSNLTLQKGLPFPRAHFLTYFLDFFSLWWINDIYAFHFIHELCFLWTDEHENTLLVTGCINEEHNTTECPQSAQTQRFKGKPTKMSQVLN